MNVCVLLPTIYRPDGLRRALSTLETSLVETIIICEKDDEEAKQIALDYMCRFCTTEKSLQGPAYAWNTGLKHAQFHDAYFLASDDIEFVPGWLHEIQKIYETTQAGLIGVNDGTGKYERAGFCTHYFMTRNFIRNVNGGVVCCPHYFADFTDVEIIERAKKVNQFAYAAEAKVIHHWREIDDEAYRRGDTRRAEAKKIYLERKAQGFPDNYKAIIK